MYKCRIFKLHGIVETIEVWLRPGDKTQLYAKSGQKTAARK